MTRCELVRVCVTCTCSVLAPGPHIPDCLLRTFHPSWQQRQFTVSALDSCAVLRSLHRVRKMWHVRIVSGLTPAQCRVVDLHIERHWKWMVESAAAAHTMSLSAIVWVRLEHLAVTSDWSTCCWR
jgi:hypothetical protein